MDEVHSEAESEHLPTLLEPATSALRIFRMRVECFRDAVGSAVDSARPAMKHFGAPFFIMFTESGALPRQCMKRVCRATPMRSPESGQSSSQ